MSEPISAGNVASKWLALAENDLATGRVLMADTRLAPESAAFHFQQAAEKALRSMLSASGADIPFTHDLPRLARLVDTIAPDAGRSWPAAFAPMNEYAVATRYPGENQPVTAADLRAAEAAAAMVIGLAAARMAPDRGV